MYKNVLYALIATTGTWFVTLLGAATTVVIKRGNERLINVVTAFSAGIMTASAIWSLLCPAIELANGFSVIISMIVGTVLLYCSEHQITKFRNFAAQIEDDDRSLIMMIISITIHNIPEGLAVGLAFGSAGVQSGDGLAAAIALAIGIGLQNFPEGAAISLPLTSRGMSKRKSFFIGQASALVEPLFGVIGAVAVALSAKIIPYCMAFAAGCMIFVVIEDLIPQSLSDGKKELPVFAFIIGFSVMTLLDIML